MEARPGGPEPRWGAAILACLAVWVVPVLLVQAANGVDNSDQAFGRVLLAVLLCGPLGLAVGYLVAIVGIRRPRKR